MKSHSCEEQFVEKLEETKVTKELFWERVLRFPISLSTLIHVLTTEGLIL